MRILIVDDDHRHGESMVDLLISHGHEAYFAPNCQEAEWLSGLFCFELSVIDFELGKVTGTEVARRLRLRSPDLDVVIISARGNMGGDRELLGNLPFFSKPIDTPSFLAFVDQLVARRFGLPLVLRESYPLRRLDS